MSETKLEFKVLVQDTRLPVGERVKVLSVWASGGNEAEKIALEAEGAGGTDAVSAVSLGPTGRKKTDQ